MINFRQLRDRLLGNPAIRDRIGRVPFGRRIAAHHARRLFGTVAGFVESQWLAAASELGLFEALRAGGCAVDGWTALTRLPEPGAAALLQGLVATGLVERRGGEIMLTIDGLVVATDPGLRAMIAHNRLLYADMADPVAMLRGGGSGRIAAFWPYAGGDGDAQGYAQLMAASQSFVAEALIAAFDFGSARHVMDVGGGDGRFVAALAERFPALRLSLADLPPVLAVARESLAARGLLDRVSLMPVQADVPLSTGADVVTLVRVLHDHDDASALHMLRRAAAALGPGGRLVIAEPMARGGRDPQTAYFAAYFAAMRSGRLRSPREIARLLARAGLRTNGRIARPSMLLTVMTGRIKS